MYDKASEQQHVNKARKELFCHKGKTVERLPPTQDALLQHLKRVAYQAGIWCTSEHSEQHAPAPEGWDGLSRKILRHENLYGMCYLLPPRRAVNLLNVAAKVREDVALDVHVEKQVGIVPIFAVVTVRTLMTKFNVFVYNHIIGFYSDSVVFFDLGNEYLHTSIMIFGC